MTAAAPPAPSSFWQGFGIHKGELCVALGVIITLLVMIFPLPRLFLDLFLSFNLTFSLMVLLLSLYTVKPIEFFIFPSLCWSPPSFASPWAWPLPVSFCSTVGRGWKPPAG